MAKRKSKAVSKKITKKVRRKSSKTHVTPPTASSNRIDDIDLLNAHRFPESFSSSEIAKIRNSSQNQERLEKLLKGTPSGKKSKNKDIKHLVTKQSTASQQTEDDEYEYVEYEVDDDGEQTPKKENSPMNTQTSPVKKFFRKYI